MFVLALCDDNEDFLSQEFNIAAEFFATQNIEFSILKFSSGNEFLEYRDIKNVDLVLLDYDMQGLSGFDTANRIREMGLNIPIAFVTVFFELAREGYRFDAIRYLVKQETTFNQELIDCICKSLQLKKSRENNIRIIEFVNETLKLSIDKIMLVQADRHYLDYYIVEGTTVKIYRKREKIVEAMSALGNSNMFSLARTGMLVNLNYVISVNKKDFIYLGTGGSKVKQIRMSDSYKKRFLSEYMRFLGEK